MEPDHAAVHEYLQSTPPSKNSVGLTDEQIITLSAKNHQNIEYLKSRLYEAVLGAELQYDQTIVTNARHYEALKQADNAIADVMRGLQSGISSDFVAMDIRQVLYHLGVISGKVSVEDLLGNIFGKFCIGK